MSLVAELDTQYPKINDNEFLYRYLQRLGSKGYKETILVVQQSGLLDPTYRTIIEDVKILSIDRVGIGSYVIITNGLNSNTVASIVNASNYVSQLSNYFTITPAGNNLILRFYEQPTLNTFSSRDDFAEIVISIKSYD